MEHVLEDNSQSATILVTSRCHESFIGNRRTTLTWRCSKGDWNACVWCSPFVYDHARICLFDARSRWPEYQGISRYFPLSVRFRISQQAARVLCWRSSEDYRPRQESRLLYSRAQSWKRYCARLSDKFACLGLCRSRYADNYGFAVTAILFPVLPEHVFSTKCSRMRTRSSHEKLPLAQLLPPFRLCRCQSWETQYALASRDCCQAGHAFSY